MIGNSISLNMMTDAALRNIADALDDVESRLERPCDREAVAVGRMAIWRLLASREADRAVNEAMWARVTGFKGIKDRV